MGALSQVPPTSGLVKMVNRCRAAVFSTSSAAICALLRPVATNRRLVATHLELVGLTNETHNVREVGVFIQTYLGQSVAPPALAADVNGYRPIVVERLEGGIENQQ